MRLKDVPVQDMIVNENRFITDSWIIFFDRLLKILNLSRPWELKSYTVATVPTAATYANNIIYVSDESGGATLAFSDGTNWRRVQDRVIIS